MSDSALFVSTEAGAIEGIAAKDRRIHVFKGVPYARPPVGELRWRAPELPQPWTGTRPATTFGPRSIQHDRDRTSISYFGPEPQDEDCLTLNVWTRASDRDQKRPVMVWFHGGGFAVGSGSLPIFDGEALARHGAVVVTVNHRLGVLGFLSHPDLTAESPHGASGNYGLLDLVAALRWVRDNIANFGGDPACVTIFGQSSGSAGVNALMASPLARGLFHRAIAQSGGLMAPLGKPGSGSMLIRADAEKLGSRYATHLGVHSIAEMRALPAESVQLSWPQALGRSPVTSLDGWFLDQEIHEAYRAGRQASVPLISGATANEGATLPALASDTTLGRALDHKYGACAQAMLDCYGEAGDASDLYRTIRGHVTFNWQNWSQAREHAPSHGAPVYAYYFDRAPPLPAGLACFENAADKLGAFHTSEIPYVFGSLAARPWNWRPADHHLSVAMGAYWINFARTGDPNGPGLPGWPRFDTETAQVQRFAETITSGPHPLRHEMMTWDSCMARLRGGR